MGEGEAAQEEVWLSSSQLEAGGREVPRPPTGDEVSAGVAGGTQLVGGGVQCYLLS